jgi:hypothetical protein
MGAHDLQELKCQNEILTMRQQVEALRSADDRGSETQVSAVP